MPKTLKDVLLKETKTLAAAATSASSTGLDLRNSSGSDFVAECELKITGPALTTSQLPDAGTITYKVEMDDNAAFSSPTTMHAAALTQTGAGGVGAATSSAQIALPVAVERYVRVTATNSVTADASAASFVSELVF